MKRPSRDHGAAPERSATSGQVRKVEVGDRDAIDAMIAALGAGLAAGDLDAEHRYAATCLRQHVTARRRDIDGSRAASPHGEARQSDLDAAVARATRLEDAVASAVAGGGTLDAYEREALHHRLREIVDLLERQSV